MNDSQEARTQHTYLRFWGVLRENLTFTPRWGWETAHIARPARQVDPAVQSRASQAGSSERFRVELLTEDRTAILAREPEIQPIDPCERTGHAARLSQVQAYLPMHPEARVLVFRRGDFVIYERGLAAEPPRVRIRSLKMQGNRVHVSWSVDHDKALPLRFNVGVVLDRKRVFPLAMRLEGKEATLDLSRIPGAKGARLAVLASDGFRSGFDVSRAFKIPAKEPQLYVARPGQNERFAADQAVSYSGRAVDIAGANLPESALVWRLDGEIVARGRHGGLLTDLSPGKYVLRLEWHASGKARHVEEVPFEVARPSRQQDRYRQLIGS